MVIQLCTKDAAKAAAAPSGPLLRPLARFAWLRQPLQPRPRLPAAAIRPRHQMGRQMLLHQVRLHVLLGAPAGQRLLHLSCCACCIIHRQRLVQVQVLRRQRLQWHMLRGQPLCCHATLAAVWGGGMEASKLCSGAANTVGRRSWCTMRATCQRHTKPRQSTLHGSQTLLAHSLCHARKAQRATLARNGAALMPTLLQRLLPRRQQGSNGLWSEALHFNRLQVRQRPQHLLQVRHCREAERGRAGCALEGSLAAGMQGHGKAMAGSV